MFCRSSWLRICIFRTFNLSSYCGVLSSPFFLASSDIKIHCGRMAANCFFICGVTLGARWLARVSNSALVMTVLQSAAEDFVAVVLAPVAAVPLAAAVLVCAGHTPLIDDRRRWGNRRGRIRRSRFGLGRARSTRHSLSPCQRSQQNTHQPPLTHKSFPPGLVR